MEPPSFVELVGFVDVQSWKRFASEHPRMAEMIGFQFDVALKHSVAKCNEILIWQKIDISKYNTPTIPRKRFNTVLSENISKQPKLYIPTDSPPKTPVLPTDPSDPSSDEHDKCLTKQNQILDSMDRIINQKENLEGLVRIYKRQETETNQTLARYQHRLLELNQRMFILINSIVAPKIPQPTTIIKP